MGHPDYTHLLTSPALKELRELRELVPSRSATHPKGKEFTFGVGEGLTAGLVYAIEFILSERVYLQLSKRVIKDLEVIKRKLL